MLGFPQTQDMLKKIERLRAQLMLRFEEGHSLSSPALIAKSRELDELVTRWHKLLDEGIRKDVRG